MTSAEFMREAMMMLALIAAINILAFAILHGCNGWLSLKRTELEVLANSRPQPAPPESQSSGARIEISDLRERIRKLEAIAAGIDI